MKREEMLIFAAIALGAYFVLRKPFEIAGKAAEAVTKFGGKVGGIIYDVVNPNPTGETLFYTVTFPNGERHSIPSSAVSSGGYFYLSGVRYRLGMLNGKRVAVPS